MRALLVTLVQSMRLQQFLKLDYAMSFLRSEKLYLLLCCFWILILTDICYMTVMAAELVRVARNESKGEPERLRYYVR